MHEWENKLTFNPVGPQQWVYRYYLSMSRTLSSRNQKVNSSFFFFFLVSLSQIILQRACPFRCNIWWEETFLPMNTVPLGIIFSFFCLLSCNLAHSKNGPHFFQLSLRHFYCGIGHIYFSKFSIGLNAGTGTQIPLSLIIRGMQFMLFITYGRTVCEVIDLSNC